MKTLTYDYAIDIDLEIYPIEVIFRVCYIYTEQFYIYIVRKEGHVLCVNMSPKDKSLTCEDVVGTFLNALVDFRVRYDISNETKNIREVLIGTALSEAKRNEH